MPQMKFTWTQAHTMYSLYTEHYICTHVDVFWQYNASFLYIGFTELSYSLVFLLTIPLHNDGIGQFLTRHPFRRLHYARGVFNTTCTSFCSFFLLHTMYLEVTLLSLLKKLGLCLTDLPLVVIYVDISPLFRNRLEKLNWLLLTNHWTPNILRSAWSCFPDFCNCLYRHQGTKYTKKLRKLQAKKWKTCISGIERVRKFNMERRTSMFYLKHLYF